MVLAAFCISILFGICSVLFIWAITASFALVSKLTVNDFKLTYWLETRQLWIAAGLAQPIYYGLIFYNYAGRPIPDNAINLTYVISSFVLGMVWGIGFTFHTAHVIKK